MDSATSALATWLRDHTRFQELVHVAACESTQALAQERCAAAAGGLSTGTVFWADHQTRGRGREGRSWHDTPGQDLAVTFALRGVVLQNPTHLAAAVPVAIARTLEGRLQPDDTMLQIKWPNDVLLRGRKISGLLIDSVGTRTDRGSTAHLVGIGVNVNRTSFPEELAETATSLALASGREFDRPALLQDLARNLESVLRDLEHGSTRLAALEEGFRDRLQLLGRKVRLQTGGTPREGRLEHLDFETVRLVGAPPIPLAHVQRLDPT